MERKHSANLNSRKEIKTPASYRPSSQLQKGMQKKSKMGMGATFSVLS